jgi:hypothetical protein
MLAYGDVHVQIHILTSAVAVGKWSATRSGHSPPPPIHIAYEIGWTTGLDDLEEKKIDPSLSNP